MFLGKDYSNLITVDLICHGVPSPGVFKWYLQEKVNKCAQSAFNSEIPDCSIRSIPKGGLKLPRGVKIEEIRFRDKREGWKKYSFVLHLSMAREIGTKESCFISEDVCKNAFLNGFVLGLYLRPSCHKCPVRSFKSGSDLTLGDFWGQEKMFPTFDSDTGVSAVIINTLKGDALFSQLEEINKEIKSLDQVISYNKSLLFSMPVPYSSRKFWKLPDGYSFEERVSRALSFSFFERAYIKINQMIKK